MLRQETVKNKEIYLIEKKKKYNFFLSNHYWFYLGGGFFLLLLLLIQVEVLGIVKCLFWFYHEEHCKSLVLIKFNKKELFLSAL